MPEKTAPNKTMKYEPAASNAMKHEQNAELLASLETVKFRLAELSKKPQADAVEIRFWKKKSEIIVGDLIKANQGLVKSIVSPLKSLVNGEDDEKELMQVGNIALAKAIENFNPELGNQLSTYAYLPVRGAMLRAINKNRTIAIPEARIGQLLALKKTIARLGAEAGEERENGMMTEPSADDLAWVMGIPVEEVRELLALHKEPISLDGHINDSDDVSGYDAIADTRTTTPSEEAETNDCMKLLEQAVNTLSERDADVFLRGFGLFGREKQSFEKIGNLHGFTRQRGQQIFETAKREVVSFLRSRRASCSGRIARQRLGLNKKTTLPAVKEVAKPAPAPGRPYRLKMRAVEKNPNHHIWNNNGTWYCNFVLVTETGEERRVRNPLYTNNVEDARRRRDKMILLYKGLLEYSAA